MRLCVPRSGLFWIPPDPPACFSNLLAEVDEEPGIWYQGYMVDVNPKGAQKG